MSSKSDVPLLSVVIPTRNRQKYAIFCVESILRIQDPDLEVVVQDNSDTRELEELLGRNVQDSRLQYSYTPTPLSFSANFDAAVRLATGEYICFIGDDDGVNPEIMESTRWAKVQGLDAIRTDLIANYYWPDVQAHDSLKHVAGKLFVRNYSGSIAFPDVENEMRKCVRNGGQSYLSLRLPKVYHGILRKKCLDQVCEMTGRYFKGLSPDIFGAMAVANFVCRLASIDYPLTIGGTSVSSGAGHSSAGKHKGRLEDAPHLRWEADYKWDELIPKFYSVETIWAESAVVALRETHRMDLLRKFNLPVLCAYCLVAHPEYAGLVLRDMYRSFQITGKNYFIGTLQLAYSLLDSQGRRSFHYGLRHLRVLHAKQADHVVDGQKNIKEASEALTAYLTASRRRFENCVRGFVP